jgi:hypothetical protein
MVRHGWLTLVAALSLISISTLAHAQAALSASVQAEATTDADPAPSEPQEELPWALLHRAYNTWSGSTGGLYLEDPGIGLQGAVRVQLGLSMFSGGDFLYEGDDVERNEQSLSVSYTALDILEVFAALQNRGVTTNYPEPLALHAMGDLAFGAKVGWPLGDIFRVGGGLRFAFRNDVGPDDSTLDSTSIGLRVLAAADLQRLSSPIPLIIRLNLDYLFDNSAQAVADIEDARYATLENAAAKRDEVRHLVSRTERYGLGINRMDMLTPSLGVEVPLELARDFYLHPMLEYRLGLPINRADYDCAYYSGENDRGSNNPEADDTCLEDAGVNAFPMHLTVGVRVVPPVRGLSIGLGVDIGVMGAKKFVRELSPVSPFEVLLTLGYDYDAEPPPPPPAPVVAPAPPPPPPRGRLLGTVIDSATNVPIPSVVVALPGAEHTPLATNVAGRFVTYELPPGEVKLELTHPEYTAGTCAGVIAAGGGVADVQCTLAPLPTTGSLTVVARSVFGAPIAGARVALTGGSTVTTGPDGQARFAELAAAEYEVRIESDAHLVRVGRALVQRRQEARLELPLAAKPAKPSVKLVEKKVQSAALKLEPGATQPSPAAQAALAELADLMLRDPALGKLRIQADGDEGLALARALALKQGLVDLGVPEARVEALQEPAKALTLTFE